MTDELQPPAPTPTITVLDGVGHYPMLESPTRFAQAVTAQPSNPTRQQLAAKAAPDARFPANSWQ